MFRFVSIWDRPKGRKVAIPVPLAPPKEDLVKMGHPPCAFWTDLGSHLVSFLAKFRLYLISFFVGLVLERRCRPILSPIEPSTCWSLHNAYTTQTPPQTCNVVNVLESSPLAIWTRGFYSVAQPDCEESEFIPKGTIGIC